MVFVCDAQKTTMVATDVVSVDAPIASVLPELESISSLKEEQRMRLKVFLKAFLEKTFSLSLFALFQTVFTEGFLDGRV